MYKYRKLIRVILLVVLLANMAIICGYWLNSSYTYLTSGTIALQLIAVGRILGLFGVLAALQQFVIIGRIPLLEQAFGQDRLSRIHRITGYVTFIFISLHSLLIVNGNALLTGKTVPNQYWFMITSYEDINKAVIALISLYLLVGSSIWIVRKRLRYEWWHLIHLLTYVFIVFAFGHQIELGTTLGSFTAFKLYWLTLYVVALGLFGFYRFLLPLMHFNAHRFKVSRVVKESHNVVSIY
ncbi:ferric reductase-like transmembrane domain-containing protein, partial [Candidatus Saccharibacteria bacterium]|nr:ferric reductase-like transmembrane domain-containing protein [Candidatus Saccharibacteria bacterium]